MFACRKVLFYACFLFCFCSSQLAISHTQESYGLIFGFNTFMALVLQAILAGVVNSWLGLETRLQVS